MSFPVVNAKRDNGDFIIFLRTILMFLEHHNFNNTVKQFKLECLKLGYSEVIQNKNIFTDIHEENAEIGETSYNETKLDKNKTIKSEIICPKCRHPIDLNKRNRRNEDDTQKLNMKKNERKPTQTKVQSKKEKPAQNHEDIDYLKSKLSNLESEHQKLTEVTMELTLALQKSIRGQTDNMNTIINNCKKIYPELFVVETNSQKIDVSKIDNFEQNLVSELDKLQNKPAIEKIDLISTNSEIQKLSTYFELDYNKIDNDLKNGVEQTKLLLLQALRWRLTKSLESIRTHVIKSYSRHDLLQLKHKSETSAKLLENLYQTMKTSDPLQQAVAQLVNTIASLKYGRDYLTHHSKLLTLLIQILINTKTKKLDYFTRDMIIATMQKLSLRYCQRVHMIKSGVVEYLVTFLNDNYKVMSTYCLEYSTALLMNLWLHNESREKCRPMAMKVIKLLGNLLDINYNTCLPFVNGALYNLLPDSYFNQAAKNVGLMHLITLRIEKTEGEMKQQLLYLTEILNNPKSWKANSEYNFGLETDTEMDILENELDEDDLTHISEKNGEEFLYDYRLVFATYVSQTESTMPQDPAQHTIPNEKPNTATQNTQTEVQNDRNNNKDKQIVLVRELAFCEEMQQYIHKPNKGEIFESRRTSLTIPERTQFSAVHSKSLPVTPNFLALLDTKPMEDTVKKLSGYRDNIPVSRTNSPLPGEGERHRNKYSCVCYDILKNSVDEEQGNQNELRNCKYNNVNSNSLQLTARSEHPKTSERDSGVGSAKLDECDYEAVFESRPKILRTP